MRLGFRRNSFARIAGRARIMRKRAIASTVPAAANARDIPRKSICFQCLGYLVLKNETKPQRLFIESYVRMMLEQNVPELTHTQNDHYTYRITSKDEKYPQAWKFAEIALTYAEDACRISNVEFERGKKVFKRG